ncbi:MAG TPA: Fur family transcriptional regulator [Pyrinomonadaceae bacterium]|jgi:Fe2+ or Zn2+ uptake regulation protein
MTTKETRGNVEARLREAELRLTPQRFAVLEYLSRAPGHPTADQIAAEINRRFPRASRATVYNALKALRDAGLVREVATAEALTRYESNVEPHHHFVCRSCGGIEDVPAGAFHVPAPARVEGGHEVETIEVTLRGLCGACKGKG